MTRRIWTNLAIVGLAMVAVIIAAMWTTALVNDQLRLIHQEFGLPPELRGNHGPWRHARVLAALYDTALLGTLFGVLPAALVGVTRERTRRAAVVAALAMVMLFVNCAHFPLFD